MSLLNRRPRAGAHSAGAPFYSSQALSSRRAGASAKARTRAIAEVLEPRRLLTVFGGVGDISAGTGAQGVATLIKSWNPDQIITFGDNFYDADPSVDNTIGRYYHDYVSPYFGSFGAGSPSGNRLWPALGNHDWDRGIANHTNYFTLPGNERYYAVTFGNTQWFILDTDAREPDGNSATSTQAQWLQSALAASTATFKLVVSHDPPYTSADSPDATWMRWPFQQWGATAVFDGDKHLYERLSVNGFPYIIVGTGGAPLHAFSTIDPSSQFRYDSGRGALRIETSNTAINFRFITSAGTVLDSLTINATNPPPPPPPPPGTSATFIPTGANWKYLDTGTNQGTAWEAVAFSDATWKSGNAQLGYGDGDEATVISFGSNANNKFITSYFRKSFTIANASAVTALNLDLKRDDGAVVYLNGTEVFRSNMPTGNIAFNTLAAASIEDEAYTTSSVNPALLLNGNNVIAVEVHQGAASSSDVSFDFDLTGTVAATPAAPTAPSGLGATVASLTQINLVWTDNATTETSYKVERSTDGSNFAPIPGLTLPANSASYNDTNLTSGQKYWYRVRANNAGGDSPPSNVSSATTAAPPAPTSLAAAAAGTSQINLTWVDASTDETGFKIERSTDGTNFGPIPGGGTAPANATSYNDSGLAQATQYWYRVRATNAAGDSEPPSNTATDTTAAPTAPAAPTNLVATGVSPTQINLTWSDNSNNEDNFVLERSPAGADSWTQIATPAANAISYADSFNLSPSTSYDYRIRASNGVGPSGDSSIATGVTQAPPVAPTNLAATALSSSQIKLTWNDNSSNETGFVLERSPNGLDTWTTAATPAANSLTVTDSAGLSASTPYFYRIRAMSGVTPSGDSNIASATTLAANTLPSPWVDGDVGATGAAGSATYSGGVFTVKGAGVDIWGTADSFNFVSQTWTGNGQIIARIASLQSGGAGAFAGVMFRETSAAGSREACLVVNAAQQGFLRRTTTGGSSSASNGVAGVPQWVKVIRNGNSFTAFRSTNGTTWTQVGSAATIAMASTVSVGLVVCSASAGNLAAFNIDGVTLSTSTSSSLAGTLSAPVTQQATFSAVAISPAPTTMRQDLMNLLA